MNKKERVQAVIDGRQPDRPPVSFWYHFPPEQATGQAAVDGHLAHLEKHDLDFLKIMNDHEYPREGVGVIHTADDLRKIKPLPGDSGELGSQLEVISKLHKQLGHDLYTCTTVFSPWAVLRRLMAPINRHHEPPKLEAIDKRDEAISCLLKEDRQAVESAIEAIAETMADFAAKCVEAGAMGIFLAVRDDWVERKENDNIRYTEIVQPADLNILKAVQAAPFNFLHICGKPLNFLEFAKYPVQVVNWADRATGPSIAYARDRVRPAIAGGVDNLFTMSEGSPTDCGNEVKDALRQARDRPIMITPGCTFDPKKVPAENLEAIVAAARGER